MPIAPPIKRQNGSGIKASAAPVGITSNTCQSGRRAYLEIVDKPVGARAAPRALGRGDGDVFKGQGRPDRVADHGDPGQVDADVHARAFGHTGSYDVQTAGLGGPTRASSIFDGRGALQGAVFESLDLIQEADAVLATSHLSAAEVIALVPIALERGVIKVVVTHPFLKTPALDLETLGGLVGRGAYAEFVYNTVSPMWHHTEVSLVQSAIAHLGPECCVLSSDGGQRHNPSPPEGLRIFAQSLFELGVTEAEIGLMVHGNPRGLLGLDALTGADWERPA